MRILLTALVALLSVTLLGPPPASAADVKPLPGGRWDYQIGGARSVPADVRVVVRDREARPTTRPRVYDVCYVNAFQTQPGERAFWKKRWHLVLKDGRGKAVVDEGWGEWVLDIRTPAKRRQLARIVGRWFDGCAADGFEATEPDNLDSFSRSRGLVTRADATAFSRLLIARAHDAGLAIAQKNWSELDGSRLGFDFAVAEQCGQYAECGSYHASYGHRVLAVEYSDASFARACGGWGDRIAVVRRDLDVSPSGVRRWC